MHDNEVKRVLEKISKEQSLIEKPQYDINNYETYQVNIKVDDKTPHGLFMPDPKMPGQYFASSQTFRAMKKNIFTVSDPDELKEPYHCKSCKTDLDKQFWHFCPMCGEAFVKDN